MVMIMSYGIIAVPTGIVTVELSHSHKKIRRRFVPNSTHKTTTRTRFSEKTARAGDDCSITIEIYYEFRYELCL